MENEKQSLYENRSQSKEINILKSILPYVNLSNQKNVSLLISFLQMQKTIEYFDNPENTMQLYAMEQKNNTLEILNVLKDNCNENEIKQIEQLQNVLQIISTYEILFNGGDLN